MTVQGEALLKITGADWVLMKGGHLKGQESDDCLMSLTERHWFSAPRIATENTHGTGCTLSSAIAAELARLNDVPKAAKTMLLVQLPMLMSLRLVRDTGQHIISGSCGVNTLDETKCFYRKWHY